jgi:exosortase
MFPIFYLIFMVPFGEALNPPLQDITAILSVAMLQWSGIPVFREGLYLATPIGQFEVAVACSGLRFLIASVAIGTLFCYLTYRTWYKLLVRATRCHTVALSEVFQRKLVQWLDKHGEKKAATWFHKYWTGERGNWTLGHAGVGGTNNNNGLESRWKKFKSAIQGGSGSTAGKLLNLSDCLN